MNTEHAARLELQTFDRLLQPWEGVIGEDYRGYRHHVIRMATFALCFTDGSQEAREKVQIAACFHDLGLWSDRTLDYLDPSAELARQYLVGVGQEGWVDDVVSMITEHHRVRPVREPGAALVEAFRKGDWVDFTLGCRRFGLPADFVRDVMGRYPNAGFHSGLVGKAGRWLLRHPLNPAPMFKW